MLSSVEEGAPGTRPGFSSSFSPYSTPTQSLSLCKQETVMTVFPTKPSIGALGNGPDFFMCCPSVRNHGPPFLHFNSTTSWCLGLNGVPSKLGHCTSVMLGRCGLSPRPAIGNRASSPHIEASACICAPNWLSIEWNCSLEQLIPLLSHSTSVHRTLATPPWPERNRVVFSATPNFSSPPLLPQAPLEPHASSPVSFCSDHGRCCSILT
jgi:hypothetical protein